MRARLLRLWRQDSGAAAVEFALVGLIAIGLMLAILEFGRSFYMRNEMSYAADIAARKVLTDRAVTDGTLETLIRDAITFGTSDELEIDLGTESVDGLSFRTLLIRYPLSLFIPALTADGVSLTVSRRIPLG